eukprot:m.268107 g.268107  ORF g.268107 m.268107 type:complete len:129 (-) comp16254_c0_seq2:791-1177(-)
MLRSVAPIGRLLLQKRVPLVLPERGLAPGRTGLITTGIQFLKKKGVFDIYHDRDHEVTYLQDPSSAPPGSQHHFLKYQDRLLPALRSCNLRRTATTSRTMLTSTPTKNSPATTSLFLTMTTSECSGTS